MQTYETCRRWFLTETVIKTVVTQMRFIRPPGARQPRSPRTTRRPASTTKATRSPLVFTLYQGHDTMARLLKKPVCTTAPSPSCADDGNPEMRLVSRSCWASPPFTIGNCVLVPSSRCRVTDLVGVDDGANLQSSPSHINFARFPCKFPTDSEEHIRTRHRCQNWLARNRGSMVFDPPTGTRPLRLFAANVAILPCI
ncbi:uncharacterized protein LY79DRAFT_150031 [Colletotrichum navitas]|uniref:Uncharacterized protein n=1 Tax=Colletotrichum navitas TaxID=681940 RepID=A0AAD8VAY2_9PEZI|nr:uncharacterized protein LY79DRAFT_150031 [Colletotrichum navitas]KAK1599734.1 hypothetical protein LY79DRAFT_150031 [Colletotrichum navitas]